MVKACDIKKIDSGVSVSPNSVDETTDLNNTSSDNLHSVSSVERRRQVNRYHTLSNKSNSSKRKNLRYNIDKYKLSKSDRKIKRRLQQQETPTPSEKVSIWHRDIFMVTPKQLKGRTGSSTVPHPRSCVCRSCLAQYGTYQYYTRAMRDQRETRTTPRESTRESRSAPRESKSQITRASSSKKHTRQSSMYISHKADEPLFSRSSSCTDSSLQVSKPKAFVDKRWCVCVVIAILFVGTFAAAGIYFGYEYLKTNQPIKERVYGGQFRVTNGKQVNDPGSIFHMQQTEEFRKKIHYLLNNSPIAKTYKGTEVFLLESDSGGILNAVHFNLHFDSDQKTRLFAKEIQSILEESLAITNAIPEVDISSLEIHERRQQLYPHKKKLFPGQEQRRPSFPLKDNIEYPIDRNVPRQCTPVQSGYCSNLPYNLTTYPNMLDHTSIDEVDMVIDQIKQVVDSGCYPLAYELLCQVVQPVCYNDRIVKPCVVFCQEFMTACDGFIPKGLLDNLKCNSLPTEADGPGACISKPGCVGEMRESGHGARVCDGVVDCPDFSDELYCDYCPEKHFHCGVGKMCIDKEKMCDGVEDCDNGADEKGCLSLAPRLSVGSYIHQYHDEGYLLYQHNGRAGKVCIEGLNKTVPEDQIEIVIERLANSTCRALEYRKMSWAAVGQDEELEDIQYVGIMTLQDSDTFQPMECPSKMVVRMECDELECGRRPANVHGKISDSNEIEVDGADITAKHGDWPWHVSLFKEGTHVCDGTLIDKQWIMSTKSCFQGQQRAKWTAQLASVRLSSRAPWEQERRIIGMVASPVESHSIVILKLDKEVVFSDFARPVCLPATDSWVQRNDSNCVSLGWDIDQGQLQVVQLDMVDKAQCEDKTEVNVNTICMEEAESEKCNGEVVAGSGLMCQAAGEWHLVGVSAWRKGCGKVGERPRLYEKVSLTSDWANTVIKQDRDKANEKIPRRRLGR